MILSGAVGGYFTYHESLSALEALQREKARVAATEIAGFMSSVEDTLRWSSTNPLTTEAGLEDLRVDLIQLLRRLPPVTEFRWITAVGSERFALSRFEPDSIDSGRDWTTDVRFVATRTSEVYVGPVYFRKESEPYISLAVAGTRGGSTLVAEINLKFVWELISDLKVGQAGAAFIVDSRGQLISHPDISLVLRKTNLSALPQVKAALEQGRKPHRSRMAQETWTT